MIDPDGSDISEVDYIAGLNLKLRTNPDNTVIEESSISSIQIDESTSNAPLKNTNAIHDPFEIEPD